MAPGWQVLDSGRMAGQGDQQDILHGAVLVKEPPPQTNAQLCGFEHPVRPMPKFRTAVQRIRLAAQLCRRLRRPAMVVPDCSPRLDTLNSL